MNRPLQRIVHFFLKRSCLHLFPVRVRGGIAAGARWTLYPWSAYWRGGYETALQNELIGMGDITGWTCWDLGAHYGLYSVGLARRTGPTGQVVSFEPNPLSFDRLERHRRMNGLSWMKPVQAAVSDTPGTAEFYTYGELESTTTHLPYDGEMRSADCTPVEVQMLRLDDLVSTGEIRVPQFIKVDVEGHGHQALNGARESIAAARPLIVVAFHSQLEVDGVKALLLPLGYSSQPVRAGASNPVGEDYLFRPERG